MIPIKIPDWFDSIRAILALILVLALCVGCFKQIPDTKLAFLKELATLAVTFYFVLKKRPEENGVSNGNKT